MSVFKKYNIDHIDKKIFLNELYFPNGKSNVKTYTKNMENILMGWLRNIVSVNDSLFFDKDVLYKGKKQERKEPFNNDIDVNEYDDEDEVDEVIDKEILFLIDQILKCTKEIIHKKIASHKNFVDHDRLLCLGTSALILSIKVYLAQDWENVYEKKEEEEEKENPKVCQRVRNILNNIYNFLTQQKDTEGDNDSSTFGTLSYFTAYHCSKKILLDMEEDLLKSSDWIPCIRTQYKSKNLPNTRGIEREKKKKMKKSKIFQKGALDSIKSHFKVLDDQNKLPPDWVKKISTTDLIPYYYNKKTHESTWDNPTLLMDDNDEDFSDSGGGGDDDYSQKTHNIVKRVKGGRKTKKTRKTRKNNKKNKKYKKNKKNNKRNNKTNKTMKAKNEKLKQSRKQKREIKKKMIKIN